MLNWTICEYVFNLELIRYLISIRRGNPYGYSSRDSKDIGIIDESLAFISHFKWSSSICASFYS